MILIEIKNGMVTKCLSNNKNLKVVILDHDTVTDTPDYIEMETEYTGTKELRIYIEESQSQNEEPEELFGGIKSSIQHICNDYKNRQL